MGFTLIEVLVALVVLVIGIYAMLRIFPPGYSAIETSQQRTVAAQLAEAELNRWRLQPDAIPDAIVATDYTGALISATLTNNPLNMGQLLVYGEVGTRVPGTESYFRWQVPPDQLPILDRLARPLIYNPNDLTPCQFDGALGFEGYPGRAVVHPNWEPNSLYLPRTIIGEQIDIRRLTTNQRGVPFYLLSHAPLDILRYEGEDDPHTPGDDRTKRYVDVYDARSWRYVAWTEPPNLGAREFTYDSANRELYFGPSSNPPSYERVFKVDYTDPRGPTRVFGLQVKVPAGSSGPGDPALPTDVDPASIQVHELMQEVDDPSLLEVVGPGARRNIYYVDDETLVTGQIQFPLALQVDPRPDDITAAKVDYRVKDWQILSFDVEVPPDGVVTLPVKPIKGPNYTNPPRQPRAQPVAHGIKKFYNMDGTERPVPSPGADDAYVVAVDRQNGEVLTENEVTIGLPAAPRERMTRFRVDYRQGRLYFNYGEWEVGSFSAEEAANATVEGGRRVYSRYGRTYRVFCRAEGDWAVQLTMAARIYARSRELPGDPPVVGSPESRLTYTWGAVSAPGAPYNPRQIYFPLSEASQVVAVDYYRKDGTFISGEVHAISGPEVADLGVWACQLVDELRYEPNDWGPVTVRGLSMRARVSWVTTGGASTLQDWVEAARNNRPVQRTLEEGWRHITVTSYLTRVPL